MIGIDFAIMNMRLGGQLSGALELIRLLSGAGADARLLLPASMRSSSAKDAADYGKLPLTKRMAEFLKLIRNREENGARQGSRTLHLVLPSPAFAWLAALAGSKAKTVLQYEGPSTAFDRAHLRAFSESPVFSAPRMLLGNSLLARLAARLPAARRAAHLATHPLIADELLRCGYANIKTLKPPPLPRKPESPAGADQKPLFPRRRGDGTFWYGYIGHAFAQKGVADLLAAFAITAREKPGLRLFLALSPDGDAGAVRQLAGELRIENMISWAGIVNPWQALAEIDALVLPYRSTISTTLYPSLVLEALAAGCPLITADLPALRPLLAMTPAGAVTLFEPRSTTSLAAALKRCPPTFRKVSANFWDMQRVIPSLLSFY